MKDNANNHGLKLGFEVGRLLSPKEPKKIFNVPQKSQFGEGER
jgi:hypothetical protein